MPNFRIALAVAGLALMAGGVAQAQTPQAATKTVAAKPAAPAAVAAKPAVRTASVTKKTTGRMVTTKTSTGKTVSYDCSKAGNKTKTACK